MKIAVSLIAAILTIAPFIQAIAEDDIGPFGIGSCHTNNRSKADNAKWIPQMEAIGLRYYRTGRTSWSAMEPVEGRWNWEPLDEQLDYLSKHRFQFGGLLIGSPKWNLKDKQGSLPVHNIEGWSKYVSAVVGHTKGSVKRWEVWNEPPNFAGKNQTPGDYAKIVVSAYNAAKTANPDCLIGLAAKSAHINYLEQVIKAGAKDHFDYITLHPYELLNGVAQRCCG
ncbi:beta-galactosidase [Verrucomicrobiaceae bacterium 227]